MKLIKEIDSPDVVSILTEILKGIRAVEEAHKMLVGINVYVPFWLDQLLISHGNLNKIQFDATSKNNKTIFGHRVLPGYENAIVISNSLIHPAPVYSIEPIWLIHD